MGTQTLVLIFFSLCGAGILLSLTAPASRQGNVLASLGRLAAIALVLAGANALLAGDTFRQRAAAGWLFFRVARSTVMIQIAVLRSCLEKQPTDLRRNSSDLGDGTLVSCPRNGILPEVEMAPNEI